MKRNTSLHRRLQRWIRLKRASQRLQTRSNDRRLLHLQDLDTDLTHIACQLLPRHSRSTLPDHLDNTTLPPDRYLHTPTQALAQPTTNCILDSTKLLSLSARISQTPWSPQVLQRLEQALLANLQHLHPPNDSTATYHLSILATLALRSLRSRQSRRRKWACAIPSEIPKPPLQRAKPGSIRMANTRRSATCDPSIPTNITKVSYHFFENLPICPCEQQLTQI
jgi:hypothetical protein